jgi:ATP-dependent DNA helicase RecG
MRYADLPKRHGLTKPIMVSSRTGRRFKASFLLHQLMSEEHLIWLQQWRPLNLSDDEAKALIFVLEMEAIDNAALRTITNLDTLESSQLLGKLWQKYHLIEKAGSGRNTYYKATSLLLNGTNLSTNRPELVSSRPDQNQNSPELISNKPNLSQELQENINKLSAKARVNKLWPIILHILVERPASSDELSHLLKRDSIALRKKHLSPMKKQGLIQHCYPEVVNHPQQAYLITEKGKQWLEKNAYQAEKQS